MRRGEKGPCLFRQGKRAVSFLAHPWGESLSSLSYLIPYCCDVSDETWRSCCSSCSSAQCSRRRQQQQQQQQHRFSTILRIYRKQLHGLESIWKHRVCTGWRRVGQRGPVGVQPASRGRARRRERLRRAGRPRRCAAARAAGPPTVLPEFPSGRLGAHAGWGGPLAGGVVGAADTLVVAAAIAARRVMELRDHAL